MNALFFLGKTLAKNRLKRLLRKPAALTLLFAVVAGVVYFTVESFRVTIDLSESFAMLQMADQQAVFGALLFALCLCFGYLVIWSGFSNATSFFTMQDVSVLFPTPASPKRILLFGMMRQLGITVVFAFVICLCANMFHATLDLRPVAVLFMMLALVLCLTLSQLLAMTVYILCNSRPKAKRAVQAILLALLVAPGAFIWKAFQETQDVFTALVSAWSSGQMEYFPFFGWIKAIAYQAYAGNYLAAAIFAALIAIGTALIIWIIFHMNCDYYEDAIDGAENREAAKYNKMTMEALGETLSHAQAAKNSKAIGLGHGTGESALFFRQIAELRRKNPFVIDIFTVVIAALSIFVAKLQNGDFVTAFVMALMFSVFLTKQGLWSKEVQKQFIFLMPGSPFRKLVWAIGPSVLKFFLDAIIIVSASGIFFKQPPLLIVCLIPLFTAFGFLFVVTDVLFLQISGHIIPDKSPLKFLGVTLFLVCITPAGAAIAAIYFFAQQLLLGILCGLAVSVITGLLILFACRNVLSKMEDL